MAKKKQVIIGEKRYKKEKARKQKLKDRVIKEKNRQAIMALRNMEKLETQRREFIAKYLEEQGYKMDDVKSVSGKARYFKEDKLYLLEKLDLSQQVLEDLGDEAAQFAGLYAIQQFGDGTKGEIFQVIYSETKGFTIKKVFDETKINSKK